MKIKFADEVTFPVKSVDSIYNVTVIPAQFSDLETLANELTTAKNLDTVELINDDETVAKSYTKLALSSNLFTVCVGETAGTYVAEFSLREKTETELRIEALEEGQAIQDGAISDIGDVLSEME